MPAISQPSAAPGTGGPAAIADEMIQSGSKWLLSALSPGASPWLGMDSIQDGNACRPPCPLPLRRAPPMPLRLRKPDLAPPAHRNQLDMIRIPQPLLPRRPDLDQLQRLPALRAPEPVQRQALVIEKIFMIEGVIVGGMLPGHGNILGRNRIEHLFQLCQSNRPNSTLRPVCSRRHPGVRTGNFAHRGGISPSRCVRRTGATEQARPPAITPSRSDPDLTISPNIAASPHKLHAPKPHRINEFGPHREFVSF